MPIMLNLLMIRHLKRAFMREVTFPKLQVVTSSIANTLIYSLSLLSESLLYDPLESIRDITISHKVFIPSEIQDELKHIVPYVRDYWLRQGDLH